jgi:hypothetical protein
MYVSLIPRTTLHSDSEQFILWSQWKGRFELGWLVLICVQAGPVGTIVRLGWAGGLQSRIMLG